MHETTSDGNLMQMFWPEPPGGSMGTGRAKVGRRADVTGAREAWIEIGGNLKIDEASFLFADGQSDFAAKLVRLGNREFKSIATFKSSIASRTWPIACRTTARLR